MNLSRLFGCLSVFLLFHPAGHSAVVCATCHPKESALYAKSPMGNSLGVPVHIPAGSVRHQRSGSSLAVEHTPDMVHRLSVSGLTASYKIDYQIGAGILGHSYITNVNGYLFQSPATWFRSSGWDVSPGYGQAPAIDFDRPITETCLFCHAANAKFSADNSRRLLSTPLTGITCDRCHGSAEEHLRHPSSSNIVNPRKLALRARDSVCEQCHLEGAVRVLNPGKTWSDFHPGANLEDTAVTYLLDRNGHEVKAVSQVEQFAQSQCALHSNGKLWCGSCHQPHAAQINRTEELRKVCKSCHLDLSNATHPAAKQDCIGCHMPSVSSEYAHVAVTDHRILRRPQSASRTNQMEFAQKESKMPVTLAVWADPPREFKRRDQILAALTVSGRPELKGAVANALQEVGSLPVPTLKRDPALLATSCDALLLEVRGVSTRLDRCRSSAETEPQNPDRALAYGKALLLSGNAAEAEQQFLRAIRLDPSLKRAYMELWNLYDNQHQNNAMLEIADRYLQWNPRNILFRRLKASLTQQ